ncbi:BlaI/MecI/CopY family transcriptional regulator, partial [Clostridioides difficile]
DKEEVSIDKIDALEEWLRSLQEDEE